MTLSLPTMAAQDLTIRGYNDNHPFKAMHTLIVGGEILDEPRYVKLLLPIAVTSY